MPIHRCRLKSGGSGFQWGQHGHCYSSRAGAERQQTAIYASGWREKAGKDYSAPVSATSGLAGYDLEGQRNRWRTRVRAKIKKVAIDRAAHDAATSPFNLKQPPTEAQDRAGNYPLGHMKIAGMDISIENPAGSKRKPEWPDLKSHYGYIRRSEGADGDSVDVFVKVGTDENFNGSVFVVDQIQPATGEFDEHKVMLGWYDAESAKSAYLENYQYGWKGFKAIQKMSLEEFKIWLRSGETTSPVASVLRRRDGARMVRLLGVTPIITH